MTTGRINQVANHVTHCLPAKGLRHITGQHCGQTITAEADQVFPVATFVFCCINQSRLLPTQHFQLPLRPCSNHHHPNSQCSRLTPCCQLIWTSSDQKSSSLSLWRIRLSQGQYHQTIGLQFTPTHCERANQHPFSGLQGTPTMVGNTAEPQAKSKQLPTLIAPKAQTLHCPPFPRSELTASFEFDSLETVVLCLLNTPNLVSSTT